MPEIVVNILWGLFWTSLGMLVYVHLGYPLLVLLLAAARRRRTAIGERPKKLPPLSLIIPAHNEQTVLRDKLENLLTCDYPRESLEVLIASDGSVDDTNRIAETFIAAHPEWNIRLLPFAERRGKASVVNDAVAEASHDLLCLCDANVMFRPDALWRLVAVLDEPAVGAATGRVELASHESNFGEGEATYYSLERAVQAAESAVGSLMGVDGGMYVVRRALFRPLPPDTILDDLLVSLRAMQSGRRIVYVPEARADESGTPTGRQEFARRTRVAAGAAQLMKRGEFPPIRRPAWLWQYVSHKLLRWLGPVWLGGLLVTNTLLLVSVPTFTAGWYALLGLALGQAAFYLIALVAARWLPLRQTKLGGVCYYFAMSHVGLAVGLLRGLGNRQRVTWQSAERKTSASAPETPTTLHS